MLWNALNLASLAIFLFMTVMPSEALAYAQYLSTSQGPLTFVLDQAVAGDLLASHNRPHRPATLRTVNRNELVEGASLPVVAFAYSSAVNQTDADPFTTATGEQAAAGTVAANWLPFGATVRIGARTYTVQDRMNPRYDNKYVIDIWQPSAEAAVAWGVRRVNVEIVNLP